MTETRKLETQTCSRCGGTGSYSYCQMYGSTCFKCGGSGRVYTKRGHAAALYLKALRQKPARDVTFGDWVKMAGVPGFSKTTFFKVTTLASTYAPQYSNHKQLELIGESPKGERMAIGTFTDSTVDLGFDKATKMAQYVQAVEYQDTLTKAGTVRKR